MMLLLDSWCRVSKIPHHLCRQKGLYISAVQTENALAQHRDCHVGTSFQDTHNAYLRAISLAQPTILITINLSHHQSHHDLGSQHRCQGSQPKSSSHFHLSADSYQPEGNTECQHTVEEDDPYDFGLPRHKLIVCCGLPYVISHSKRVS